MSKSTMDEPVPIARTHLELYAAETLPLQNSRWIQLREEFINNYDGAEVSFIARSPGRVNLLGEHIDYSLYEVLPMAIAADILIAVSILDGAPKNRAHVAVANVNFDRFKPLDFTFPAVGDVEIDPTNHHWTNYFKAGLRGAISLLRQKRPDFSPVSMQVLVDGTVPAGGGLSSSAAFVCASALAVLRANGETEIIKKELVELAITSERSVGVNSGGMDQAASVFSIRGDALSVSFSPTLHASAIAFPQISPPITFMIAQSFVAADKHVSAPECYNLRVVECTLAAEFVAATVKLNLPDDSSPLKRSLRGLQIAYFSSPHAPTSTAADTDTEVSPLKAMLALIETHLTDPSGYTRETIAATLGIDVPTLESRYMSTFPIRASRFLLLQRAQHVYNEAIRVTQFKALLQNPPQPSSTQSSTEPHPLLPALGDLMNATQTSCRTLYDCSCPELDELCEIARRAGTYGSRLTGAGWGGCSVHLVPRERVEEVRLALEKEYYLKKWPGMSREKLKEGVVISGAEGGSCL
ncbi:galactokinase [Varicellaria rhodocarpa]|nr:galactokinase [Varicellaria rhodocarpa]